MNRKIYHFELLNSTNIKAKELAEYEEEGTVIVADEQTMGKGRLGRNWISHKGKGIYMSIILKPHIELEKASRITSIGASAVFLALKEMGIESKIKWPNDLLLNNKKICGILTEVNGEQDKIKFVIMGIGINVNLEENDIPMELRESATSLKIQMGELIDKDKLMELILDCFEELYTSFKNEEKLKRVLEICKKNSSLIGREIKVIKGNEIKMGKAIDIDENGELIVEFEDGIKAINSGEVSVR